MTSRALAVAVLVLAVGCSSTAPQKSDESNPPWLRELAPRRIVYSVSGMEQIAARKDVVYKRVGDIALVMDIWRSAAHARPVVILIHGGPVPAGLRTQPKDWGVYRSYGQLIAASGFVAITFNHRFHDRDRLSDAHADMRELIAYVRDHAAELGVDGTRMCLWAFSGGGSLLSVALREPAPPVRCLVSYYAQLDVRPDRAEYPTLSAAVLSDASPLYHLEAGRAVPPMLIARAGKDAPVINRTVDDFVRLATERKAPLQVLEHPTGRHGFDTLDDDARSREVIADTVRFIASHLE